MEQMAARIVQLEVDNGITKTELIDVLFQIEAQKVAMADAVEREFASVKIKLDNLINDTSRELGNLDKANRELLERTVTAVDTLDLRLRAVENKAASGGGGDYGRETRDSKTRRCLVFKSTIPESLGNGPTKWRTLKTDAL